eukprot:4441245-Pyramimonas_sp.AAC.2
MYMCVCSLSTRNSTGNDAWLPWRGGMVCAGENVELVPGEKIVQKWKFSNWGDKYSTVTITLKVRACVRRDVTS